MITVTVTGADPQRAKLAAKIAELFLAMGLPTLHYPKANLKPPQYPEGLEVAVLEKSSEKCQTCVNYARIVDAMVQGARAAGLEPDDWTHGLPDCSGYVPPMPTVIGTCTHCGRPDPKSGATGFSMHIPPKEGTGDA